MLGIILVCNRIFLTLPVKIFGLSNTMMLTSLDHILSFMEMPKAISSRFSWFYSIYVNVVCISLFRCFLPIKSLWEAIIVFKGSDDVMLEFERDDGKLIPLDRSEEDLVIRGWKRKYAKKVFTFISQILIVSEERTDGRLMNNYP